MIILYKPKRPLAIPPKVFFCCTSLEYFYVDAESESRNWCHFFVLFYEICYIFTNFQCLQKVDFTFQNHQHESQNTDYRCLRANWNGVDPQTSKNVRHRKRGGGRYSKVEQRHREFGDF